MTYFVIAVINWYSTLYTGVQDMPNDINDSKFDKSNANDTIEDISRQDSI